MKSIDEMAYGNEQLANRARLALAYVYWINTHRVGHAPSGSEIKRYVAETISGFRVNRNKRLLKKELKRFSDLDVMRLLSEYGLVEHTDCLEQRNERPSSLHGKGLVVPEEIAQNYLQDTTINPMSPSYPRYSPARFLPNP